MVAIERLSEETQTLASELEHKLMVLYGTPIIAGEDLVKAMGYRSIHSLRKHIYDNTFPIELITIPGRRGKFALVRDVAIWLAEQKTLSQQTG